MRFAPFLPRPAIVAQAQRLGAGEVDRGPARRPGPLREPPAPPGRGVRAGLHAARYYEPWTGRFLSEDPAMDGANWYVYCGNDPVNKVDPDGRLAEQAVVGLLKFLLGLFISGEIEAVLSRIDNITRYMAQLDEIIEQSVKSGRSLSWPESQQRQYRNEIRGLLKSLRSLRYKEKIVRVGSRIGGTLDKFLGYVLIVGALIDDIDLGLEWIGSLEAVFGD
ncbi:MAG: RHS repeat-associated core domain-containing protein [Fimbriimonadaceae bacterium]|nr:RHS repeat-associated core domain-containing protein [Fimbriimonadaceae bacterium]QYK58952.1 MAG: RHS repeat-associated core domain-containing protein [Fimbriimonadaceae bacterium]